MRLSTTVQDAIHEIAVAVPKAGEPVAKDAPPPMLLTHSQGIAQLIMATNAGISVNAGATYCVAAWIRATSDALPFLGMQLSDAAGNLTGPEHWLIGLSGYTTGYPNNDTVTAVTSDGNWAWYSKSLVMDAGATHVVLKDENVIGASADFDMIQIFAGDCPSAPTSLCAEPQLTCQPGVCTNNVCASGKLSH